MVRAAVDSARREDTTGIVKVVLRCCVDVCLSAVEFLNKFTINFAAITGEAYCTSARMTYELLRRNLLSTVFVETISTRLLGGIVFVLSAVYAVVVSCTSLKLWLSLHSPLLESSYMMANCSRKATLVYCRLFISSVPPPGVEVQIVVIWLECFLKTMFLS